jgi:hypothetical protein
MAVLGRSNLERLDQSMMPNRNVPVQAPVLCSRLSPVARLTGPSRRTESDSEFGHGLQLS